MRISSHTTLATHFDLPRKSLHLANLDSLGFRNSTSLSDFRGPALPLRIILYREVLELSGPRNEMMLGVPLNIFPASLRILDENSLLYPSIAII